MEDQEIVSVAALLDVCSRALSRALGDDRVWFRGLDRAYPEGELVPAAFRGDAAKNEYPLLMEFQLAAPSRHQPVPQTDDHVGWLALAQHHGLATRLLDWTESLLVACHFATAGSKEDPGEIWLLRADALNEVMAGYRARALPTDRTVQLAAGQAFRENDLPEGSRQAYRDLVLAFEPTQTSPRIMIQRGKFTIHGSGEPLEKHPFRADWLTRLSLTPKAKQEIRTLLLLAGIDKAYLFPDLDNLTDRVMSMYEPQEPYRVIGSPVAPPEEG